MEPVTDFNHFEDWNSFTPLLGGYIAPRPVLNSHLSIMDMLTEGVEKVDTVDSELVGHSSLKECVDPGLVIEGVPGLLRFPLTERDIQEIGNGGYQSEQGLMTVPAAKIKTSNPRWNRAFNIACNEADAALGIFWGRLARSYVLRSFNVVHEGSKPHVDTTYAGKTEGLINIIVLPTHAPSIAVTICYAGKAITRSFEGDLRFKATSMVTYHGYDYIRLAAPQGGPIPFLICDLHEPTNIFSFKPPAHAIAGVITEFRDLFADWRYRLNDDGVDSGAPDVLLHPLEIFDVDDVGRLDDTNRKLVAHLVSPAKAYGFRILLGRVKHEMQCTHELQHEYKEYLETEDEWEEVLDWEMEDCEEDPELEWGKVTTLGGRVLDENLTEDVVSRIRHAWDEQELEDEFLEQDPEKEVECEDDSCYYATIRLTHVRRATHLIILPE